jgi:hypothetical protein
VLPAGGLAPECDPAFFLSFFVRDLSWVTGDAWQSCQHGALSKLGSTQRCRVEGSGVTDPLGLLMCQVWVGTSLAGPCPIAQSEISIKNVLKDMHRKPFIVAGVAVLTGN